MMKDSEIKSTARANTIAKLNDVFTQYDAVQFADGSWAILEIVDGQEVWCEISVKSKAFKPTKISPIFDPYEVAEQWKEEKEIKEKAKAEKAKEKAAKVKEKKD